MSHIAENGQQMPTDQADRHAGVLGAMIINSAQANQDKVLSE